MVLLLLVPGTLLVGGPAVLGARGWVQRLFLLGFVAGLLIWSGIGAAYPGVSVYYLVCYFVFLLAFVVSFRASLRVFSGVGPLVHNSVTTVLSTVYRGRMWGVVIFIYIGLSLFPLVYPDLRLQELFTLAPPDLRAALATRWAKQETDTLAGLVQYGRLLLTPFFYIALYRYRKRWVIGALLLVGLAYIRYVSAGYLGRGDMALAGALLLLAAWRLFPSRRRTLAVVGMVSAVLMLWGFYFYGVVRIGGLPEDRGLLENIASVLAVEVSFPKVAGMTIIDSGASVDASAYLTWVATLPLPKLLVGPVGGARINYEISELVLGVAPGEPGFYIVLPGLVAESIYIFGQSLFWLHALLLGVVGAFVVRLVERTPQLLFLTLYLALQFAYTLNRAGISAVLPTLTNELMLFYVFVFFVVIGPRRPVCVAKEERLSRAGLV
jgi:hypothetical protein